MMLKIDICFVKGCTCKDKIQDDENVIAGFVIKNEMEFEYVVNNSDMYDEHDCRDSHMQCSCSASIITVKTITWI